MTVLVVAALAGCRTEPAVAAYVENLTISTDELAAAVDQRLADENIAAVVEPGDADYQRLVLSQLVQQSIYRILSADYGVEVTDRQVQDKLDELLSGDGPQGGEDVFAQLAAEQMLSELDVRENVRQALIRAAIAAEEGLDGPTQEPALRQRYEEIKDQLSMIELGFITVPDQETADTTLATVLADPASYDDLAATYAGPNTQPTLRRAPLTDVPGPLLPSVAQTAAGQGFTVAIPDTGGIVVGYVASLEVPSFEEVRSEIRTEAASGVDAAVGPIVTEFVSGLDIDINPRYGSLDQGRVV
ncbi:MAG: SurA N-terminal domain-containing protein, partial [Geodermatophilaceae bacterium]|nr:SurA N-terminal domain-containing protein [Geodermatophilaceae bacterium]